MTRRTLKRVSAERDVEEIFVYVGLDNIDAALAFLEAIDETLKTLAESPYIGSVREFSDQRTKRLRMWPVRGFAKYEVFYFVEDEAIEIVRVLHSARDIPTILGKH